MTDSLRELVKSGIEISTVLDVGVLTGTAPLIHTFGQVTHHLFEPVGLHFPQIEKNYQNIQHKIHHVALSDTDGRAYLACRSIHGDGKVTHAEVVDEPVSPADVEGLVECLEIAKARLDTVMERERPDPPLLLKIDVDGHEMKVLNGSPKTLEQSAIVVIEAPLNRAELPHFFERSQFLMKSGFHLMDIAELAYYDGILWQVDLVFVRGDLVHRLPKLRPFETPGFCFERENWYPLTERYFSGGG
jgi:FkbM family methyltransferase